MVINYALQIAFVAAWSSLVGWKALAYLTVSSFFSMGPHRTSHETPRQDDASTIVMAERSLA